jgi:hypothetical protein
MKERIKGREAQGGGGEVSGQPPLTPVARCEAVSGERKG